MTPASPRRLAPGSARRRGVAAILAMMFLVVFGSLAAAMAIVAQGNLSTADAHLKINRAQSAAETGMRWIVHRLNLVAQDVKTTDGLINGASGGNAQSLWSQVVTKLMDPDYSQSIVGEAHHLASPTLSGTTLALGPIAVAPGAPTFTAQLLQHPITGEDYDGDYYQRAPYSELATPVSAANPLDSTWVRVRVTATDGPTNSPVSRTLQMDFQIAKRLRFAILSKSRIMIGRNVMIEGPIGSRYLETNLANGHPVQMVSDFRGLSSALDTELDTLVGTLTTNDMDGDNRIHLANPSEVDGIDDPEQFDHNDDGYIDEYDFLLNAFDSNDDGRISQTELTTSGVTAIDAQQLMQLIDTFGSDGRTGYNDGFIDNDDRYAKVSGSVLIKASLASWQDGAAGGAYQDHFQGPIKPAYGDDALTFEASETTVHSFGPEDFDVSTFRTLAEEGNTFTDQVAANAAQHDPGNPASPKLPGETVFEAVPYGAAHPYDFYSRPVYENMTFTNIKIPKGTNALFKNCTFRGVTFIESTVVNFVAHPLDPTVNAFNYAGMQEADGSVKHPDIDNAVGSTKSLANNIRFDNCTFEGAVVSDAPQEFTHVRNKISFTGDTKFDIDGSSYLTSAQKDLYKRSTILSPHYSVEMGTFIDPTNAAESVELTGTIVAGVADFRGNVRIRGTLVTTFEPTTNTGPVVGETSPQFNTTLGYFPSSQGDLEAELPTSGFGVIHLRYDESIPMPDGILGPIEISPVMASYFEVAP